MADDLRELPTAELLERGAALVVRLARAELALALAELREDARHELGRVRSLAVAAVVGMAALNLLLVTVVLALARGMPAWAATLTTGGAAAIAAIIAGTLVGRARPPLERTRRHLEEDTRWMKEQIS